MIFFCHLVCSDDVIDINEDTVWMASCDHIASRTVWALRGETYSVHGFAARH